jgi:competence protein ComEA
MLRSLIFALIFLFLVPAMSMSNSKPEAVDINTASAEHMAKHMKNIDLKEAKDIVAHREKHGHFKSVEDLGKIIGRKQAEENTGHVSFGHRHGH